ncbi:hypothetical protein FA15DRAFT_117697 [Coprinopsis marcescibilis]|uniref:Type 1 phosphatases regulator n=1 Tax=Coprinopsis marcescibilis TaxID=230819 RepID=A0A5C3L583_COPMA|nr:hypothetical protein FA15DRAFT_117697 [Coprinopsis marcescibilis]
MDYSTTSLRPTTSAPSDGSRTITITSNPTNEGDIDESNVVGTLRLRGHKKNSSQKVAWDDSVVDNEGCGKKKSKICCIFRPARNFDESSSDSDSDSDESSCDGHHHDQEEGRASGGSNQQARPGPSRIHEGCSSDDEKNAYERLPSSQRKKKLEKEKGKQVPT